MACKTTPLHGKDLLTEKMLAEGQSGKTPLTAHSETVFTMEGTGVEFLKDEKGAITAMIEHWVEGDRKYVRLDHR